MESYDLAGKEYRFPLLDALTEQATREGFAHLSSELDFYGITSADEITEAVEGCLRMLRHAADDAQRHFRSTFVWTPQGIRQLWLVSDAGWELLLLRIAPASPALSRRLLRGMRRFPRE